jgi:hypothetical protein
VAAAIARASNNTLERTGSAGHSASR